MLWVCGGQAAWQAGESEYKNLYFLRVRAHEGPPGGGGYRSSNTDSNLYVWELPIWDKNSALHVCKTVCIYTPAGSTLILHTDSRNVKPENFFA